MLAARGAMRKLAGGAPYLRCLLLRALGDAGALVERLPAERREKTVTRLSMVLGQYLRAWEVTPPPPRARAGGGGAAAHHDDALCRDLLALLARAPGARGGAAGAGAGAVHWRYELTAAWCVCLLYTSPSPRDGLLSRMPSSA